MGDKAKIQKELSILTDRLQKVKARLGLSTNHIASEELLSWLSIGDSLLWVSGMHLIHWCRHSAVLTRAAQHRLSTPSLAALRALHCGIWASIAGAKSAVSVKQFFF